MLGRIWGRGSGSCCCCCCCFVSLGFCFCFAFDKIDTTWNIHIYFSHGSPNGLWGQTIVSKSRRWHQVGLRNGCPPQKPISGFGSQFLEIRDWEESRATERTHEKRSGSKLNSFQFVEIGSRSWLNIKQRNRHLTVTGVLRWEERLVWRGGRRRRGHRAGIIYQEKEKRKTKNKKRWLPGKGSQMLPSN